MPNPSELERQLIESEQIDTVQPMRLTEHTASKPVIDNLIPDIYKLFEKQRIIDEGNLKLFLDNLGTVMRNHFNEQPRDGSYELRMSKIGTKNRKAWYEAHAIELGLQPEILTGKTKLKFLYGDILEQLLLFLTKEAGHSVTSEQKEITVEGVKGHLDANIDNYVVDVKSASSYAFKKFKLGTLTEDDPFGYIDQLSGYLHAETQTAIEDSIVPPPEGAAYLAINKETADLALLKLHNIDRTDPASRIKELKEVLQLPEPPQEKCYDPVPQSKTSSNLKLNPNCGFCAFKDRCWSDANNGKGLRKFQYSEKVEELVLVVDTPRVPEIFGNQIEKEAMQDV